MLQLLSAACPLLRVPLGATLPHAKLAARQLLERRLDERLLDLLRHDDKVRDWNFPNRSGPPGEADLAAHVRRMPAVGNELLPAAQNFDLVVVVTGHRDLDAGRVVAAEDEQALGRIPAATVRYRPA